MPRKAPWVSDAVYAAGQRFVSECLERDGSLFTPGDPIWDVADIDDFYERFVVNEVTAGGSFMERLEMQLAGAGDRTVQLTAELLFFHYLCEGDTKGETKRAAVLRVLGWMREPVQIPEELDAAFGSGLARIGLAKTQRWQQLHFLVGFLQEWKRLGADDRDRLLADAWAFQAFVRGLPRHSASVQIEGLLHLVFPGPFEAVVSPSAKRAIASAFAAVPGVADAGDVDRQLQAIRAALTPYLGEDMTFYRSALRPVWDKPPGPWTAFLDWAERLYAEPGFDAAERDYKLEVAANLAAARAGLADVGWLELLRKAFGPPNNLTNWREHSAFLSWLDEQPEDGKAMLRELWDGDWRAELAGGLNRIPRDILHGRAVRTSLASFLLGAVDPFGRPFLRWTVYESACRLVGRETVAAEAKVGDLYDDFLELLDELRVRLLARGVPTRDRLDAQSIVWWLTSAEPPESWNEEDRRAFLAYRGGERAARPGPTRAWLVRGEKAYGTNLVPRWLEEGFVSVGRAEEGDIPVGTTRAEIVEQLQRLASEDDPARFGPRADAGNRFVNLMSPGDLVLTVDAESVYFALVSGELEWDEGAEPGAARRRAAEWLNPESPLQRERLPESARQLLRPPTVIDMTAAGPELATLAGVEWGGATVGHDDRSEAARTAIPAASQALASELFVSLSWLQRDVIELLNEKKQVIFYGPPGTGKTYVAQALGRHVEGAGGSWRLVQFHPAYSYEDFFEGYRPLQAEEDGPLQFQLRHGPLRDMVTAARKAPSVPHLLVIDEINRGNLPKIFGELYFLLEYRDRDVRLQYSPEDEFSLPENLYVVGTMNTADRSIALVDSALRRRFYFVPFLPRESPVRDVLGSWLAARGFDETPAQLLAELNEALGDRDGGGDEFAIGPSYFMPKTGEPDLERVWKHAILPLLEERFYGALSREQVEADFGFRAIRRRLAGEPEAEAEDVEDSAPDLPDT